MPRLFIIFIFSITSFLCFSQNQTKNIIKVADEECNNGNYFYAIELYQELLSTDSLNFNLIWKIGEANRLSKNFTEAEKYYLKLIELNKNQNFEAFNLNFGLTLKSQGKYNEAIDYFKTAKKDFTKDRKSYEYQKAKHEIESCLWAKEAIKDSNDLVIQPFSISINSTNAEFAGIHFQNDFYFSSIQSFNNSPFKSSIYKFSNDSLMPFLGDSTNSIDFANGSFSLDGKRFYYSNCKDNKCVIMVSKNIKGEWQKGDSLGVIINEENSNTTMPAIGKIDGEEILFFCSDREKSKGKLDIWYSSIKNGNQYSKAKNIKSINSIENEVSPWFDTLENKLYFASTWNENFGGFDLFESSYTTQFETPKNLGLPVNSSYNDLYLSKIEDTIYFTSNRIGSLSETFPTCCNDLFKAHPPKIIEEPTEFKNEIIVQEESLAELNKRLPIKLYFHNDIPNPRSIDTTTKVNYINSYNDYHRMIDQYKEEYSKGLIGDDAEIAKEDITDFFNEYVIQGVKNLELFRKQLLIELEKGAQINLQIKGFASPLAKSNYNTNLTKRRIYSLINYLSEYDNGIFLPYINKTAENGGHLTFEEIPFGEDNANKLTSDNPNDTKNSIYSRAAALERKIEIRSVTTASEAVKVDETIQEEPFSLSSNNPLFQFNRIPQNTIVKAQFKIKNTSDKVIEIDSIEIPCDCNSVEMQRTIQPNEEITVEVTFNSENYEGKEIIKSVYIKAKNQSEKLRLVIVGKVD